MLTFIDLVNAFAFIIPMKKKNIRNSHTVKLKKLYDFVSILNELLDSHKVVMGSIRIKDKVDFSMSAS